MRNIVLIGFMGTGKTSVGHVLAERLGLAFVDMDASIEEREGRPITEIFATDGEPYFRTVERAVVQELATKDGLVIGTGGGVVLDPDNISDFSATGLVVCLQATPETILERVAHDTNRPLLAGDDKMQKILGILDKRRHLYAALPHQVDTNGLTVDDVAEMIVALYEGPDD
ncbi:MAG: shikimate kinase [Kiritimatiellia bacterium]|jgi:shikimate kinase|nr:shikimate kinase [Kiritimatiellia bacterium]MDP6631459.1 shikimate kinase [Kiritimatiellia bacterium]MDP6811539.1 shikimate kinase [Kiritimatiellia bacterium]MDP7024931.1 shikimate kinase [Kiritimatiellia bacterium]